MKNYVNTKNYQKNDTPDCSPSLDFEDGVYEDVEKDMWFLRVKVPVYL